MNCIHQCEHLTEAFCREKQCTMPILTEMKAQIICKKVGLMRNIKGEWK